MSTDPKPDREGNLAYGASSNELERGVWDDINAIRAESLLMHRDAADELTRAIEQSESAPLVLGEIRETIDRLASQADSPFAELENLLAAPSETSLALERGLLADLLQEGTGARRILERGMLFCKHRKYTEAIEWWTLQRRGLDPQTSGQHLLLLVMESLTLVWAGEPRKAEAVRSRVRAHPMFKSIRARQIEQP